MDYSNWEKERARLKKEILEELRVQKDQIQVLVLSKSFNFDPNGTTSDSSYGPFYFETHYQKIPDINFGQSLQFKDKPLVFVPYVREWILTNGLVEGFRLGMYPIIDVPSGVNRHTVSWIVRGKASRYKTDNISESWTASYNLMDATHLNITDKAEDY